MDPQQVLEELKAALSNSNDNLADCADAPDATGNARILAYL